MESTNSNIEPELQVYTSDRSADSHTTDRMANEQSNTQLTEEKSIFLQSEIRLLEELGPRLSGSPSHIALIDHVASQLSELGLEVQRDKHTFTRWNVQNDKNHLRLQIDGVDVEVSSAYPYSGVTGPNALNAPLRLVSGNRQWSKARGAIAVFEVSHVAVDHNIVLYAWDQTQKYEPVLNPVLSGGVFGPKLDEARKAGVLGVICVWRNMATDNAAGQYVPFTEPYHDLPALWVAGQAAEHVLKSTKAGANAHFLLDAMLIPDCAMETIWAVSPGEIKNETILIVSHSDGTNAVEENGHIGLVELAKDAVKNKHRRTMIYILTTGHLRIPSVSLHGRATSAWLEAHKDLWAGGENQARALAGLVIEHLGAREFIEDAVADTYGPSGRPEPETLYATSKPLYDLVLKEWSGAYSNAKDIFAPGPFMYLGEGQPLYKRKIPAISLVTAPQYILAERDDNLVDIEVLFRQVESFRRLQCSLDTMSSFGEVRKPTLWERLVGGIRAFTLFL